MRRTLVVLLVVDALLSAEAGLAFGNADADIYTGCLTQGGPRFFGARNTLR